MRANLNDLYWALYKYSPFLYLKKKLEKKVHLRLCIKVLLNYCYITHSAFIFNRIEITDLKEKRRLDTLVRIHVLHNETNLDKVLSCCCFNLSLLNVVLFEFHLYFDDGFMFMWENSYK